MKRNRYRIITTAAFLMAAVVVFGQNKSAGINLSLWNKVSTQPVNSRQQTYLNIGLMSQENKIHGVSVNLLGNKVVNNVKGLQVAGLTTITGESSYGLNIAGLLTLNGEYANGVTMAGLSNIVGESQHGLMVGGLLNIIGIDSKGIAIPGLANINGYNSQGIALAGLTNILGEDMKGVAIAGLLNIAESVRGVSISTLLNLSNNTKGLSFATLNINSENFYGLQSGLLNINTEQFYGLQAGLLNIGIEHHGIQLGLINYYQEQLKGMQIGLININSNTKYSLLAYASNQTKANIAIRFKNKLFYNIIGIGAPFLHFNDKFSGSINYRTGIHYPIGKSFDISGDIGYQHINTFKNKDKSKGIARRMYSLQARLNAEYIINPQWSILASGGYETTRWYSQSHTYRKGLLAEGGIAYTL